MYKAKDIADWFTWRINSDLESGDNITNLKVQKLIYYAQGFSLVVNDRPLFDEDIVAWPHGPVVVEVYEALKANGSQPLPTPEAFDPLSISEDDQNLLEDVFAVYGQFSAWGLRNLTHEEDPWKNVRAHEVITHSSLRDYFSNQIEQNG